ncbi:MAG TPA: tetratricopeptide repeat protein [Magnetospirillum sp.]|nr:tetratricopeptide repeat protein [Magnetospirillum sp.]
MILRRAAFLALPLLAACAGAPSPADNDARVADAVEPSLRAAASSAEAARDYKGAAQHWGTLYQRHPGNADIALSFARVLRYAGQPQQSADLMQAQLETKPNDPDLLTELGKDYLAADRLPLALASLERARAAAPDRWEIHSALGVALDTAGRYAEAAPSYAKALALSPDNPRVLNNLALSQALAGQLDDAITTLTRAADHPKAGTQIRQNLAVLLALKGDTAQAEKLVRQDLPTDMSRNNAAILRALAGQRE